MAIHDPKWPCMTQNGPKTLPMGMLHDIMSWWTTLGPFQRQTGATLASEKAPGWPNMAYNHVLCPCEMFKGHFGSCRDILGHGGIFWVMKFLHCRAILGQEWPFLVMKGHYGAALGHFGAPMGLCKGPRVVQHDKISCNIPMGSVLGPFGVM